MNENGLNDLDNFGIPLLEMANLPARVHNFGVDVKLNLLQPGKRVYQHAERVKVFGRLHSKV